MQFRVPYTAYEGQTSGVVLSDGEMIVEAVAANQAENMVKAMVGGGGVNRVIIHGVFNN